MKNIYEQVRIADYNDEELLKYIGFLYEELKSLDEKQKGDEYIQELAEKLKSYKAETYGDRKKELRNFLKASRIVAAARDLKFTPPSAYNDVDKDS